MDGYMLILSDNIAFYNIIMQIQKNELYIMSFYTYTIYDYKWISMLILIFGDDLMSFVSSLFIHSFYLLCFVSIPHLSVGCPFT